MSSFENGAAWPVWNESPNLAVSAARAPISTLDQESISNAPAFARVKLAPALPDHIEMRISRSVLVLATLVSVAATIAPAAVDAQPRAKSYKNCTALNGDYPHGVGKRGARDVVRGSTKPVTNFVRNNALYNANSSKDRDGDGVACEKR